MFGPSHCVAILRWKQAERSALRYLHEEDRKRITPLIELTPLTFKSRKTPNRVATALDPTQVVHQEAKKLLESCANFPSATRRSRAVSCCMGAVSARI